MHFPLLTFLLAILAPNSLLANFMITEFVADNDGSTLDEDGDATDWIEINNPGADTASTAGIETLKNLPQA